LQTLIIIQPLHRMGEAMSQNSEIAEKLRGILRLRYEPVAVKLIRPGEALPEGYVIPDHNISHCQSIMRARKGEKLLLPAEKHSCPAGGSALGVMETPTKIQTGEFHYRIGMFETQEAAKAMIDARTEMGEEIAATMVAPLAEADFEPDAVVIVDMPERLYWLVAATTYMTGGRVPMSTAAFQATCVDATIIPIVEQRINFSMGCYGCRRRTDISLDEMIVGIPNAKLPKLVEALEKIAVGPMEKVVKDGTRDYIIIKV